MSKRTQIIVFDVNETILDIEVLNPFFQRTFGSARIMREWFAELILYSQALTLSGKYINFNKLAMSVLDMFAKGRAVTLEKHDIADFVNIMRKLPAHSDVPQALDMLRDAGFRMVTLTNSPAETSKLLLDQAKLSGYFEKQFSVDSVKKFKPSPDAYQMVATNLGVTLNQLRLVSAHTWDTLGATGAGCLSALVVRPYNAPLGIGAQPDIVDVDLIEVAQKIIAIDD